MHEALNELQQQAHTFVELFIVVVIVELEPSLVVLTQANFAEGATNVKLVSLKLIPHPVRQDTEKVNDLAHSRVDFVPAHVDSLRAAEPQTSNRCDFIDSPDLENFVDKSGLIEPQKLFFNCLNLGLHLVIRILLRFQTQLKLVVLGPVLSVLAFNRAFVLAQLRDFLI